MILKRINDSEQLISTITSATVVVAGSINETTISYFIES